MFRNRKSPPKYKYADYPKDSKWGALRILDGKYEGVIFKFGIVSLSDDENHCSVNFTYDILKNPNYLPEDASMRSVMGEILVEILKKNYGGEYDDNDDHGNADSVQSGPE
tara:strand:+ start:6564 stop:6893 length:330 start_codon:yes stop_codon:yes gene_type:complete